MLAKPYSTHTSEWIWPFLLRIYLTLPLRTHRKRRPWHSTDIDPTSSYISFYIEMVMLTQDKQVISIPKIHLGQKNQDASTSLTSQVQQSCRQHEYNVHDTSISIIFSKYYPVSATYYCQHVTFLCQYTIYLSWHANIINIINVACRHIKRWSCMST